MMVLLDHVNDPMRTVANMVWTRESGKSSKSGGIAPKHKGQRNKDVITTQPKGKKELKQSIKQNMEEFQKLMEEDDDDLLDESEYDQDELIRDATPLPQK
ncbi:hypothetical protein RHMOL_Rhmol11G0010000 [Rhododendron molle]|uniref:Uncharacterized protein n=1 Tax=Rhododendron molle TaxID=49168 RepID=A0ACC0LNC6_RHOML|nr:hypothetical protein RHMOL_Rhmol11G0010000 [Rhododendron molle]